ncbi:hypothetical protein SAMN05421810_102286 [Amycolatopsis arida]|uniref:Uncharacterized protein n=1 Tax=Amycolatopsis arida TaxID=587909 RepID=A0A1I5PI79_9PSEU|nr:hypothetical protein CLV69_101286 [Amycolatopsis arida]SFP33196.1 hypothetical protein SAMN05421810_102286 [Amycolatopsis arida]
MASALALTAAPAAASPLPEFDFTDCPTLPAGADPARWRCEVLVSTGTLRISRREVPLRAMRLTFAEGRLDGRYAQVFGSLVAEPSPVPWLPGVTLRPRYAGHSDFESNDERKGEIDLAFTVRGPLPGASCAIGSEVEPVHSEIQQVGETELLSPDPPVLRFRSVDERLALPATTGCGPLARLLDHRLGLPSPSGRNSLRQVTLVGLRPYA